MTNRRNYPRLRSGKLEGGGIPPHYVNEKKKEVVFHIPSGNPATLGIPTWMRAFSSDYKGSCIRCEESFYRLRAKVNES